jgi:hypothetical protein
VQEELPEAACVRTGLHRARGETTKPIERSHVATRDLWGREMPTATWGICAASCGAMLAYLLLLVTFARALIGSRADLAVEILLVRQQLAVLTRPTRKRPRLQPLDRAFWALTRRLRCDWRQHVLIVRLETVIGRHRQGWKLL